MSPRTRLTDVLKGALVFGIAAPPVGSFIFVCGLLAQYIIAAASGESAWATSVFKSIALLFLLAPLYSYIVGAVPAVIVGAVAGYWRRHSASKLYPLLIGLLGGSLALLYLALAGTDWGLLKVSENAANKLVFFLAPGFCAAALVALLFRKGRPNTPLTEPHLGGVDA